MYQNGVETAQRSQRRCAEETPEQGDYNEGFQHVERTDNRTAGATGDAVEQVHRPQASLDDEQHTIGGTPQHEGPVGPVPYTTYGKDNNRIERPARHPHTVASEGNVEVVAEPRRERDMPAAPEFLDAATKIRCLEVVGQREAHSQRTAQGDAGIAEEVAVNLERVEEHGQQHIATAIHFGAGIHIVDECSHVVGHNHLEKQAE